MSRCVTPRCRSASTTAFAIAGGAPTVDVDHADIAAEGESEVRRIVVVHSLKARLHALRMVGIRGERALLDGLRHLGRALDEELPGLPLEILLAHFEQVRGDLLCLV